MLIYGKNSCLEYLKKNKKVKTLYLDRSFSDKNIISLIENLKIKPHFYTKYELDQLAEENHQGIIIDVGEYEYCDLDDVISDEQGLIVVLDHIMDTHNFGAIIRTCEAASVDAIIIPKDRQVPVNATVMKTSVGTLDSMKIVQVPNLATTIDQLKEHGFWVVGTALDDSVDYRDIDYSGNIALVIGNEGKGISNLVKKKCDFLAKIPMYGTTNSLNASVASGIMIYEVIRNRK